MDAGKVTEADRYRCVFLARFKVINDATRTVTLRNYEIEIDPQGSGVADIRERYSEPVISNAPRLEVRVYEENAVSLERSDLLGDTADALERCKNALEREGYTIVHF